MPHSILSCSGLALALLPAAFGTTALLYPDAALSAVFRFPAPQDATAQKLTSSIMRVYGLRNIAVSYLLALIWSTGNDKLKGRGLFVGLLLCVGDGMISRHLIGEGQWNHWAYVPVISGVCAGLLGWFD